MKHFTEPNGRFVIQVPIEWHYKNITVGHKEVSPFSFEQYPGQIGAFQISCYSEQERKFPKSDAVQKYDTDNLNFMKRRMDGGGFNIHLWYALVEDHAFMAKYIYDTNRQGQKEIIAELEKAEKSLATLMLIPPDQRDIAIEIDKYEKFMASLAASFDLKNKAIEGNSIIELLVIIANQIDAYLRMAIVIHKQIKEKTNRIDISLLFQGDGEIPITERKIYGQAKKLDIITQKLFEKLISLYTERNKVIHRYIISDFKTVCLYQIVCDYETACEEVRLSLKALEDLQFSGGIGIHAYRNPRFEPLDQHVKMLYSQVNDKHLLKELLREVKE